MLEHMAERLAKAQIRMPSLFIVVFVLITALLVPGIFRLMGNVEPSLEKVLPDQVKEIDIMNDMRTQFRADMMYIVLRTEPPLSDVRNPQALEYMDLLSQKIRERDYVYEVMSPSQVVKERFGGIIPESIDVVRGEDDPRLERYFNNDHSLAVLMVRSDTGASAELITRVVEGVEEDVDSLEQYNPGLDVSITGFNAIDKATFEVIISDFMVITMVSMAFVMLVVWITFGRFLKGMLPMAVVMVALIWTMGIAGYANLTITVVTMVAAAMIMGLGIDFGIHQVHLFYAKRKDHGREQSLIETVKELLRAMLGASFTTSAGFLALLFGTLPAMKTLGIVLATGIISTLVGAVFLLPVIIYLYDTYTREVIQ